MLKGLSLFIFVLVSPLIYASSETIEETKYEWLIYKDNAHLSKKEIAKLVECVSLDYECVTNRLAQSSALLDQLPGNISRALAFNNITLAAHYFNQNKHVCPLLFDYITLKFYARDLTHERPLFTDKKYISWVKNRNAEYINGEEKRCGLLPEKWPLYLKKQNTLYCITFEC